MNVAAHVICLYIIPPKPPSLGGKALAVPVIGVIGVPSDNKLHTSPLVRDNRQR
jgi:hypothetical protein